MKYTEETLPDEATYLFNKMLQSAGFIPGWTEQAIASENPVLTLASTIRDWAAESLYGTSDPALEEVLQMVSEEVNYEALAAYWLQVELDDSDALPVGDWIMREVTARLEAEEAVVRPPWMLRALEGGQAFTSLHFDYWVGTSDRDRRKIGGRVNAKINVEFDLDSLDLSEEEKNSQEVVDALEIGWVGGTCIRKGQAHEIQKWADSTETSRHGFQWLANCRKFKFAEIDEPIIYVESVRLKKEWRGCDIGLDAVATYCDVLGSGFVFMQPAPFLHDGIDQEEQKQFAKKLKKHWKKLGLKHFDSGYLYQPDWVSPKKIAGYPIY